MRSVAMKSSVLSSRNTRGASPMLIAPVIFCTVVMGIAGVEDVKKVGKTGGLALVYFEIMSTVALLIGPQTFSAAEDFSVAFDAMHRGPLIGRATGGSTGAPLYFPLPGGGSARVCAKHDTYPGGKEFVGVGIQPSVVVEPSVHDIQNGMDATLQKALTLLGSMH